MAEEKLEETTPKTEEQPTAEVVTQPEITVEELTKQLGDKDAENKKLRQAVARHSESEHKLKDQSETLTNLHKRMEGQEEVIAEIADYIDELRGTPVEEVRTPRGSHKEQLDQRRKERVGAEVKPAANPAVDEFVGYMKAQGLTIESALVKEAIAEDRSPEEALSYLRDKVKTSEDAKLSKLAEEKAQILFEQKAKADGLTTQGARGPSGPANSWRDLSADEKIAQGVAGKK